LESPKANLSGFSLFDGRRIHYFNWRTIFRVGAALSTNTKVLAAMTKRRDPWKFRVDQLRMFVKAQELNNRFS
jgi:hypothetical protein